MALTDIVLELAEKLAPPMILIPMTVNVEGLQSKLFADD